MNEKIRQYIEELFRDVPQSRRAGELKEEMLINLNEKYEDLSKDYDEARAYELVIEGMGDPAELVGFLRDGAEEPGRTEAAIGGADEIDAVVVEAYSLNISVNASDDDVLSANVRPTAGKSGVKSRIMTERVGNRLVIRQEKRPWYYLFYPIFERLDVRLPRGYSGGLEIRCKSGNAEICQGAPARLSRLTLDMLSGNVRLGDIACGAYNVECVSGNIAVGSLSGSGEIVCLSGKIDIDRLSGESHRLRLTSGNLAAERLTGNVNAELSAGNVKIGSFRGAGSFSATSGNIRIDIGELSGDCSLRSTSGNIKAQVAKDAPFKLEAICRSGSIKTNLNELYDAKGKRAVAESGANPKHTLHASVVSGNVNVNVK